MSALSRRGKSSRLALWRGKMSDAFAKSINLAKWESICQLAEGGAMWRFLKNSCREGVDYRHSDPSASVWDAVDDPNLPNFRVPDVERRNVLITPRCVSDFLARSCARA
eukprot:jgi/Mesvir1/15097/Mv14737-RA.1